VAKVLNRSTAEMLVNLFNNGLAKKCPDCGYAPGERGDDNSPAKEVRQAECDDPVATTVLGYSILNPRLRALGSSTNDGIRLTWPGPAFLGHEPTEVYMGQEAVSDHVKSLAGRILTIIDASFMEGSQRTAFKSLIKREVRTTMNRLMDFFMPGVAYGRQTAKDDEVMQEL
jgi:hypothetical protein